MPFEIFAANSDAVTPGRARASRDVAIGVGIVGL